MTDATDLAATYGIFGSPPADLAASAANAVQMSPVYPGSAALEAAPPGSLASITMAAVPSTLERRRDLALMLRALAPGAPFSVLAPKDKGGARLRSELEAFGCSVAETVKRHHRICRGVRPELLQGIDGAVGEGAPRLVPEIGLWSQPGLFSWNRIDAGTAVLLEALPSLSGQGADLGCGVGMLAHGVLASAKVTGLHLVDFDRRAIEASRRNVDDARAAFHWLDVRREIPAEALDFVVTNPPFHDGGSEDRSLGARFIEQAAAMLRSGGELWLVANRHMPYEQVLGKRYRQVVRHAEMRGFKVMSARK